MHFRALFELAHRSFVYVANFERSLMWHSQRHPRKITNGVTIVALSYQGGARVGTIRKPL